jgi:hypothetical protein
MVLKGCENSGHPGICICGRRKYFLPKLKCQLTDIVQEVDRVSGNQTIQRILVVAHSMGMSKPMLLCSLRDYDLGLRHWRNGSQERSYIYYISYSIIVEHKLRLIQNRIIYIFFNFQIVQVH